MSAVDHSYAHCRRIARSRARNFYHSFRLLSRCQRDAMCAVYAIMRRADDIADDAEQSLQARQEKLADWRRQVLDALSGSAADDAVLPAFQDAVRRHGIPHHYILELIDGMASDLAEPVYESFDDLYRYCYQAASVVGLTTVHVFGFESDRALPFAEKCGVAFQLTNMLRDISEDAKLGRVYFPEAEIKEFGLSRGELLEGTLKRQDERFQRFMDFQWKRADEHYSQAAPLLSMVPAESQPALWAMVATYRGVLRRIRQTGYDVLERRVGLAASEKLWIVARALRARATGGTLLFPA